VLDSCASVKNRRAEGAQWRFNAAGQICISPKRFIVQNTIKEEFIQEVLAFAGNIEMGYDYDVRAEVEKHFSGAPSKPGKMIMNCLYSEEAAMDAERKIIRTLEQGGKLLCGGKRRGAFIEPTVIDGVTADMDVAGIWRSWGR
jgi:succinate-semialdehyde dehydrogenase/glutarate-semialdehyde dehydrogenase